MSRIFHRPMFRIGGSAGGITSGLRRGYADGEDVQISDELLGTRTIKVVLQQVILLIKKK